MNNLTPNNSYFVYGDGNGKPPMDKWKWRKYGQKSIKKSAYQRSYYRCTSKACQARKVVELRNKEPAMYVITYTSEHNHTEPAPRVLRNRNGRRATNKNVVHEQPPPPPPPPTPVYNPPPQIPMVQEVENYNDNIIEIGNDGENGVMDMEELLVPEDDCESEEIGCLIPNPIVVEDFFMGLRELGVNHFSYVSPAPSSGTNDCFVGSCAGGSTKGSNGGGSIGAP